MNKAIMMGRLAADPELRRTANDTAVTSFTIAVNRQYAKEGNTPTDWIDCVAWKQSAEFIYKHFHKGKMILIEGSMQTRSYEDREGNKRKATELVVDRAEFCGDKIESPLGEYKARTFEPGGFDTTGDNDEEFTALTPNDDLPF